MAQPPQMSLQDLLGQANQTAEGIRAKQMEDKKMGEADKMRYAKQLDMDQLKKLFGADTEQEAVEKATAGGRSVKVGDISAGQDPTIKMVMTNLKGQQSAVKHSLDTYQKGLPDLQKRYQASVEGMEAANDPKQMGSVGQARTLMLKAMGMNRYNDNEAAAVLPPTLHSLASTVFNKFGDDSNPLNQQQKAAINQFFQGHLSHIKDSHEQLKQNALTSYQLDPYYDPSKESAIKEKLGKPFDKSLGEATSRFQNVPNTGAPQVPTGQPEPGIMDKLKSYLTGAKQQQAPSAPAGFDPDAYLKGK